jgi:sec-independent protein translocase protein TatB
MTPDFRFLAVFFSGGPGAGEWALLFFVIFVLFGPRRLPEIARMLGRLMDSLRRASHEFRDQVMAIEEEDGAAAGCGSDGPPTGSRSKAERMLPPLPDGVGEGAAPDGRGPDLQPGDEPGSGGPDELAG